jgi:hypothetical protein
MKTGRPTKYSQELADQICEKIATSNKGLRTICKELDITTMSVLRWLADEDKKEFCVQYARAKEQQADFLAEEILEIADDSSNDTKIITRGRETIEVENTEWTSRSKLRVDARKWIASKLKPKKYGDKMDVTTDGEKINNVKVEVIKSDAPLAGSEGEVKLD